MKRLSFFALAFLTIFFALPQKAAAIGVLYSRPLNSTEEYRKVWIKNVDATVSIQGQAAVTHCDQTFLNEMNQTVETVWIFPLPEGAVVTELYYWFNGKRYKAEIREAAEARRDYESHIRQRIDPALLEYLGDNLFRLSVGPVNPNSEVRTEITYIEMLTYEFGRVEYAFMMDAASLSPKPLNRLSVDLTLETQSAIKYFRCPSHGSTLAATIAQVSDKKYTLVYGDENCMPDKDLMIEYETVRTDVELSMFRYTPVPADSFGTDSFYAVWITPPDSIAPDEVIPRKIVFVADVSSSMEGLRIEQLKAALHAFIGNLRSDDFFNIIAFGTRVVPFRENLTQAAPSEIAAADVFVSDLGALGLTDINSALTQALAQSFSDGYFNMIVFITDGYPTWGETFVPDILANVTAANTADARIFTFGVGEVSKPLLMQLAVENGGYATFITADDSIAAVVGGHLMRVSKPVLADLSIQIDGLVTSDKYPRPLPDLFWGSQVVQFGLYSSSGTVPVVLSGIVRGQAQQFNADADFAGTPGGYAFVPRLWAKSKIDFLLDQIAMYGELDELKNQVIELSLRFGILTPYTAFYSDPENPDPNDPGDNSGALEVDADRIGANREFRLHANYPNPFNPSTAIRFDMPLAGRVKIAVYDLNGRLIRVLTDGARNAGSYSVTWDGFDSAGNPVPSGIYVCRMEVRTGDTKRFVRSIKMGLVR